MSPGVMPFLNTALEASRTASLCFKAISAQKTTERHVLVSRTTAAVKYKCAFSEICLLQAVKKLHPRDPKLLRSGLVQWVRA